MNFDLADVQTMKLKRVTAEHQGTTSYLDKDYQLITITNTDNENDVTSYYFNDKNKADKIEVVMPAMGNAKMTIVRKMNKS